MKWLFIVLLTANLLYFGWEFDRQITMDLANARQALKVPAGTESLELISEMNVLPSVRGQQASAQNVNETGEELSTTPDILQTDIKIEEEFVNQLVTQLPDIVSTDISGDLVNEESMCFTFGPFPDNQQASELIEWFAEYQVQYEQRLETGREKQLFWIYLQPEGSRNSAMEAIEDLKKKGIKDYRLIESGNMQNAISLGLFSTQASVNKRLNELKDKGYHPVVIPYRDAEAVSWIDVRLNGQRDILNRMFTGLPARFNSIPVECSKIALR